MAGLDIAIVAAFVVYAAVSGLRARATAQRDLEQYFLAGRTLPGWKAGISMAATQFAADTPLVVTGMVATLGIFGLWRLWIYALAFLLMGFVLAACWRRAGVITDAELAELRYGGAAATALRGFKALYLGTVFNCVALAIVMLAATRIAEPFLTWHQWLPAAVIEPLARGLHALDLPLTLVAGDAAALPFAAWEVSASNAISLALIIGVTLFYSTTGGLRAVVNTDVVQFVLMMAGSLAFAWIVATHPDVGGLARIPERLAAAFADRGGGPGGITAEQVLAFTPSAAKEATLAVLAVYAIQWIAQINADGSGYLAQRCMACRSDRDGVTAALTFTVAQVLVRSLVWLPIGLGLILIYAPDPALSGAALAAEREQTFVLGMRDLLPVGVKGLLLTAMLAALASTVDTHLNWGASYWTNDIYKRFVCEMWLQREPDGRALVRAARMSNLLILAAALVVMTRLGSIRDAWEASLLIGAGVGVTLVLRWLWWRLNAMGEIAAIVASAILIPVALIWIESEALQLLITAGGATAAGVAVALLTPPEDMARLKEFYLRVQPPGFWGPVARAANGDAVADRRSLGRGLAATALAALSVFWLLIGLGSWIAGSPPPPWLPWRGPWITGLIVLGAALIPIWWRLGFARRRAPGQVRT
jgi:Na+/proline symporter